MLYFNMNATGAEAKKLETICRQVRNICPTIGIGMILASVFISDLLGVAAGVATLVLGGGLFESGLQLGKYVEYFRVRHMRRRSVERIVRCERWSEIGNKLHEEQIIVRNDPYLLNDTLVTVELTTWLEDTAIEFGAKEVPNKSVSMKYYLYRN